MFWLFCVVSVNNARIRLTTKDGFEVIDPETGRQVFSTDFSQLKFPEETESIQAEEINTNRVTTMSSPTERGCTSMGARTIIFFFCVSSS